MQDDDDKDGQADDDVRPSRKRKRTAKEDVKIDVRNEINDTKGQSSTTVDATTQTKTTISTDQGDDLNDEIAITQVVEEKKMVKVVVKGKAPVDEAFSKKNSVHVYSDEETVWDALLNCTNIGNNNNKFYIIQLLQTDSFKEYYVFNKWGRVGYSNSSRTSCSGPTTSLDNAKREFAKKFREKTGNDWSVVCQDISKFVSNSNKYTLLKRDYDEDKGDDKQDKKKVKNKEKEKPKSIPESKLHPKVQDIMQVIFGKLQVLTKIIFILSVCKIFLYYRRESME
jgi:poly [ADP-ribose] polymerase